VRLIRSLALVGLSVSLHLRSSLFPEIKTTINAILARRTSFFVLFRAVAFQHEMK
jgi:hypothetical protein